MSGFVIQIKADAGAAVSSTKALGVELDKVEQGASKARDALGRFTGGAKTGLDGAKQSAGGLTEELKRMASTGRAFEQLTSQFEREAAILERIRGPMREFRADMDALNMLWRKGALSAAEYNAELRKLQASLERTQAASSNGPGALSRAAGGMLGGLSGGVGGAAAGVAGGFGVGAAVAAGKELLELGDAYTSLQNRMKSLGEENGNLQKNMDATFAIAQNARMEWSAVGESYARIVRATAAMGVSQERAGAITETLAKAMKLGGASASESASAMLQLTQALGSGRLAGEEFNAIAEAAPQLLDAIARQMHVSRGALKQLASDGKITGEVMVAAFEGMKNSVDAGFAKTAPTLADGWATFKNEIMKTVGEMHLAEKLGPVLTEVFSLLGNAFKIVTEFLGPLIDLFRTAMEIIGPLIEFVQVCIQNLIELGKLLVSSGLKDAAELVDKYQAGLAKTAIEEQNVRMAAAQLTIGIWDQAKAYVGAAEALGGYLSRLGAAPTAMASVNRGIMASMKALAETLKDPWDPDKYKHLGAKEHRGQQREKSLAELGIGEGTTIDNGFYYGHEKFGTTKSGGGISVLEQPIETAKVDQGFALGIDDEMKRMEAIAKRREEQNEYLQTAGKRYEEFEHNATDALSDVDRGLKSIRHDILDTASVIESALTNAFKGIEDQIVNLVTKGKFEWRSLVDSMLADMTRLMFRQGLKMAFSAIGLPGFKDGADFVVPGSGGPDTVPISFMASPGERVTVTPQGQPGPQSTTARVTVINTTDPKQAALAALNTREGSALVMNTVLNNIETIRGHVNRR